MIDINELRRLAQAATPHVGHACKYQDAHWLREGHVDFENADLFIASERPQEDAAFYAAVNPTTVIELLDRLESAESDCLEQARLNGMGASREAAPMAKLEAAEKERDALRASIEAMEQQEPVAWMPLEKSQDGRNAVRKFFRETLNRWDFDNYINQRLAADFACVLGGYFHTLPSAKGE